MKFSTQPVDRAIGSTEDLDAVSPPLDDTVPTAALIRASLEVALSRTSGPLVLAVSGGRDSMALMHAMARWGGDRLAAVATFDHGTGGYATDAAALVAADARRLGLTVVRERARVAAHSEAAWRAARWRFLHRVARAFGAHVATAHTRDDQTETIVMRLFRGAGARGLAALAAPSNIVRPWLSVSRAEVAQWASIEGVSFLDDPMNVSRYYQRGRVRHDLLPAFECAQPGFSSAMLALGERAAAWRRDVEAYVDTLGLTTVRPGVMRVASDVFDATTAMGRAVLWPACFARLGVVLDARGTQELVRFNMSRRRGAYVAL
ncbi:MAG: tRNA lysidine(34) synthetase TilS, partial [Gemmatimonas sp.]